MQFVRHLKNWKSCTFVKTSTLLLQPRKWSYLFNHFPMTCLVAAKTDDDAIKRFAREKFVSKTGIWDSMGHYLPIIALISAQK